MVTTYKMLSSSNGDLWTPLREHCSHYASTADYHQMLQKDINLTGTVCAGEILDNHPTDL